MVGHNAKGFGVKCRSRFLGLFMRWSQRCIAASLLVGGPLLAQTSVPSSTVNSPAVSAAEDTAKTAASPAALGSLEILTDTQGINFDPYLSRILHDVKQRWMELIPESARTKRGNVVLELAILKDGSVAGLRMVKTSGEVALDRPAWGSISGSNPFPPLPHEFNGPYIGLRFRYYYNESPPSLPMASIFKDVLKKHQRENIASEKDAKTDLEHDFSALTALLDDKNLDPSDALAVRFFRALAYSDMDFIQRLDGLPSDTSGAEQALSDLDQVLAAKTDIPVWGITIPDVAYYAGAIAWIDLRSDSRTLSYWQRCADSGHAGCMLNLAGAYVAGWGGVQPDAAKALDLNLKAFDSGNRNVCAGAYAAVSIAGLIYFMGAYPENHDPVSWIHKSYPLFEAIESRPSSKDSCGGSTARIDEFLYRLSRGDRQDDLLSQASQHLGPDPRSRPDLIKYLTGSLDARAFEAAVESSKMDGDRCYSYFHAMWYAYIKGDTALVNRFYEPIVKFDRHTCPASLIFAKKFLSNGGKDVSNQLTQAAKASPESALVPGGSDLDEAATLYRNGKFDEAAKRYERLLNAEAKSAEAYAGLARVYLKQNKLREAHDTVLKGLTVVDTAPIHIVLGELLFREGKLTEAEAEWLNVMNSGHVDARTHLGLARVSAAAMQYRQAKAEVDKAYLLDPNDPDIQAFWTRSVRPSGQTTCRVSGGLAPLETDLLVLSGDRPSQTRGYGLNVSVNGQNSRLLVDTGSHGIVIDRKLAQKAGLTKISDTKVGGFGDQGRSAGYFATANSIKVGVLEFRDCPVTVIDKRSVLGEDGLIGTDVFEQFLIDLDFPNNKLRLGKLPRLTDKDPGEASTADTAGPTYTTLAKRFRPADFSFSFVPVYRFGHLLLIPTEVGELPDQRLFAIDTGAPRNIFSVSTARDFTKVNENARVAIKGLSGSVKRVYDAEKTALHFANVQQYADTETALNLEAMSDEVGTEVSGVLGVLNLRTLDVVLDYRDGFVAFDFTPEH
jgi:TonB family protein